LDLKGVREVLILAARTTMRHRLDFSLVASQDSVVSRKTAAQKTTNAVVRW